LQERPPAELVWKVREMYEERVSDVRFLIPVLNGLTKPEVVAALPKLVVLSPAVVKEAFNRLLSPPGATGGGPLTPAELLVALHNVDPAKCDTKSVIKAIGLCLQDRAIFAQEVLVLALQQLVEQPSTPLLFMRTVIQAVSLYPRMAAFVMNILQRLIVKQVWKDSRLWDGFVRCCKHTAPQSYAVVLQLPPSQLLEFLAAAPDMREPLLLHVQAFTDAQRAHVPAAVMEALYNEDVLAVKERQAAQAANAAAVDNDDDSREEFAPAAEAPPEPAADPE